MIRFAFGASVVISLVALGLAYAQDSSKKSKKPETSKSAEFDAANLTKLAVLVVGSTDRDGQSEQQRLVEDVFIECLLAKGHTIVARSDVDSVLKEKNFQESDMAEQLAASVGKVLNVPAVLVIRITENSVDKPQSSNHIGKSSIGARLISVENGSILWTGKHSESSSLPSPAALGGVLLKTASALAETFPDKKSTIDAVTEKTVDPKALPKVAVIVVGARSGLRSRRSEIQTDHQRLVEDALMPVLIQKGYSVVSRSDLQAVAKEQQFQRSGLTEDNAVALGKLLNVPAILLVMITDFSQETRRESTRQATMVRAAVGARLVNVGSGEIWWTHGDAQQKEVASKGGTTEVLDKVAKEVGEFFPPASDSKKSLMTQAERLEKLGQASSAMNYYRCIMRTFPNTNESARAESKLNALKSRLGSAGK